MCTRLKIDTTPFANSFLLLMTVAGVLTIDLFGTASCNGHHKILYRIELVFSAGRSGTKSPVLSISENAPGNNVVEDRILPSDFYATCFGAALSVIQNTGQVNIRPPYSSPNPARSFNIPHQNSDEEEAFILPVDVA